jgi:hypothetical protein
MSIGLRLTLTLWVIVSILILARLVHGQAPADPITNPDIFLKTTPAQPDKSQRAWEKMQQHETYEHDKQDIRRALSCV